MKWHHLKVAFVALPLLFGAGLVTAERGAYGYLGTGYNNHHIRHSGYARHNQYYRHHQVRRSHHRHHRNGGNNEGAYLLGGLLVGSLITHAIHSSNNQTGYVGRSTQVYGSAPARGVVYTRGSTRVIDNSNGSVAGRHFYRDIDGNCFERTFDSAGNELLSELPAGDCDW